MAPGLSNVVVLGLPSQQTQKAMMKIIVCKGLTKVNKII